MTLLLAWFVLVALSVAYVAWDAIRYNPEVGVMRWAFVLVTLYTGPIGLILYILACKEPYPGTHAQFVRPLWKQTVGSTMHCVAGDATGIFTAAVVTTSLRLPMWQDTIVEYLFGFSFGWFIFQALFMKSMMGGSYRKAVRMSFLPEWLSMNSMMGGMIPVMVILMSRIMQAMDARTLGFWGVMSLAALVGGAVAYPINYWMVSHGIKHGMMTDERREAENVRLRGAPFPDPGPAGGMAKHGGALPVSRPEIFAMALLSILTLVAGVIVAAAYGDFTMRPSGG